MSGLRATSAPADGDRLGLVIGNREWVGWQRIQVTRSVDTIPASFDLEVTEHYPDLAAELVAKPGDSCQIKIGGDLVLTGYVDRYAAIVGSSAHNVRILGRSKSEDLVDCCVVIDPKKAMYSGSALSIIQELAKPYNVNITSIAGPGRNMQPFAINYGETVWEVADRLLRVSQLIAYDLPDGSVQLAQAGKEQMASGFEQGRNIEQAAVAYSMDERFSKYEGHVVATVVFGTDAGPNLPGVGDPVYDPGVPRFRLHYVLSEQTQDGMPIAHDRAVWEMNRRSGRSLAVTLTTDAWRDSARALWAPNHLAPIKLPALKVDETQKWTIGQVTYTRDETGQHATLVLMPPGAFLPEPTAYMPTPALVQDIEKNNPAKKP
jgi:prophage tail gpP-like protein